MSGWWSCMTVWRSIIDRLAPDEAAVEETFVNKNPTSTLKLGLARGVVLLVPARAGFAVAEYGANHVKKSVVGAGHADKVQVQAMVGMLLPGITDLLRRRSRCAGGRHLPCPSSPDPGGRSPGRRPALL